jgi:hypothetical protein
MELPVASSANAKSLSQSTLSTKPKHQKRRAKMSGDSFLRGGKHPSLIQSCLTGRNGGFCLSISYLLFFLLKKNYIFTWFLGGGGGGGGHGVAKALTLACCATLVSSHNGGCRQRHSYKDGS